MDGVGGRRREEEEKKAASKNSAAAIYLRDCVHLPHHEIVNYQIDIFYW